MHDPNSRDGFFGGQLQLRQPQHGHRAGHDAVLLAASVAARAGDVVVELGAGIGTAGLGVALRVPGIDLTLMEIDPGLAALAADNAAHNGIAARVLNADVTDRAALQGRAMAAGIADAVLMNPPFNDGRHQASPDALRRTAHLAGSETLPEWVRAAAWLLKPRGMVTLIWRADGLADVLTALGKAFGGAVVQPVHPASDKPAVRILVRAVKGSRAPLSILPGLSLDGSAARVDVAMKGQGGLPLAEFGAAGGKRSAVTAAPSRSNAPARP